MGDNDVNMSKLDHLYIGLVTLTHFFCHGWKWNASNLIPVFKKGKGE